MPAVPTPFRAMSLLMLALLLVGCGGSDDASPVRQGRTVYGDSCAVCHGSGGQGQVGPGLADVVETWPSCDGHVEWIEVGSEGWRSRHGDSYGATKRPIEGGMPAHVGVLTDDQMRLVALFERVTYGGQPEAEALADCQVGE